MTLADVSIVVAILSIGIVASAAGWCFWLVLPELIRRWQWWQITRQAVRRRKVLDRAWAKELREIERQLNAPAMQRDRELATWRKHW